MAEDEDQSSKTEDPTSRKLDKLREEGNVPTSREVNHIFALIGMLLTVAIAGPYSLKVIGNLFATLLQQAGQLEISERTAVGAILSHTAFQAMIALIPVLIIFMILGYVGGIIQTGPIFSGKPIQPSLEKISPLAGFKRLFSLKSVAELLKSILKFLVIGTAMFMAIMHFLPQILQLVQVSLGGTLKTTQTLLIVTIGTALGFMLLLAFIDYLFQRFQYIKQHRMTRKELKDEMKESEGDPYVKQRQRQIRMERARNRMMSNVPKADVIITNPTHYSIALRYKPEEGDAAPVLVAKGVDFVAMRIREVAKEYDIPLYEDPPLARQLYAEVEIDETIPLQLYEVVAKVIAFIGELKQRKARA